MNIKPSKEKKMTTQPQVATLAGYTINVLLDLGNCFRLSNGHNTLSVCNIRDFLNKSYANLEKFNIDSQAIYIVQT